MVSVVSDTSQSVPLRIGMKMRTSDQLTDLSGCRVCLETLDLKAPVNGTGRFELNYGFGVIFLTVRNVVCKDNVQTKDIHFCFVFFFPKKVLV